MNIPKMVVDLDDWGEQELDFKASSEISTDFTAELLKQASGYDYYDSVYNKLKGIYARKHLYLDQYSAQKYREIEEFLKQDGKPTVKAIDSAVAEDAELYRLKEELGVIQNQMERIKGHMTALGQKHSNLKELSRRERWNLSMSNGDVDEVEAQEMPSRQPRRGRKKRNTSEN